MYLYYCGDASGLESKIVLFILMVRFCILFVLIFIYWFGTFLGQEVDNDELNYAQEDKDGAHQHENINCLG